MMRIAEMPAVVERDAPTLLLEGAESLGVRLTDAAARGFARYYAELTRWNRRVNLTAITEWDAAQILHFVDSLSAAAALPQAALEGGRVVDVGSGAGFPGIPLKLAYPSMRLALVEARGKKAAFLREICDTLGLRDVEVRAGRAETLAHEPDLREGFDAALARAVDDTAVLAELTLPFVRVGGLAALHKKGDIADELARAEGAICALGGSLREVKQVATAHLDGGRALVMIDKVGATPSKFPRRPGMPAKRPLS